MLPRPDPRGSSRARLIFAVALVLLRVEHRRFVLVLRVARLVIAHVAPAFSPARSSPASGCSYTAARPCGGLPTLASELNKLPITQRARQRAIHNSPPLI